MVFCRSILAFVLWCGCVEYLDLCLATVISASRPMMMLMMLLLPKYQSQQRIQKALEFQTSSIFEVGHIFPKTERSLSVGSFLSTYWLTLCSVENGGICFCFVVTSSLRSMLLNCVPSLSKLFKWAHSQTDSFHLECKWCHSLYLFPFLVVCALLATTICFRFISLSDLPIIRAVKSRKFYWLLNEKLILTLESDRILACAVCTYFVR